MTYLGQPALVAPYHRQSAPASVHVVAFLQYLGGLALLAGAALVTMLSLGRNRIGSVTIELSRPVRDGLTGGGFVIAGALGVVAIMWLVIARRLQRGAQWARIVVLVLSLLAVLGTGYRAWLGRDVHVLGGLALPLLYLLLLNTRAARSWFRWGDY